MKPQANFKDDLALIGLSPEVLKQGIEAIADGPDCWTKRNEVYLDAVKSAYRATMRRLHPDVCKDPDATEKAALVNDAMDRLQQVQIRPRPEPVMQMPTVIIWNQPGWTNSATSTSAWPGSFRVWIR